MPEERWLITGALGCIGAWCCRQLAREEQAVVAFDLGDDHRRVRNIGRPSEHVSDVVAAIEAALPESAGMITFKEDVLLPLPEQMDAERPVTTPLQEGVRETIELLERALRRAPDAAGRVAM